MNFPAILMFVLSPGLLAFLLRKKFKKSYPTVAKYPSSWLKFIFGCCIGGFIITRLTIALLG